MSFLVSTDKATQTAPLWFQALLGKKLMAEQQVPFYAALGRFITAYALAEAGVHIAARYFSGLSEKNARVIFAGMRLGDLSERLRKLTLNTSHFSSVDELLLQLDVIGTERDKLVHRLVEYDPKHGLTVTNKLTVKSLENVEIHNFSIDELEAMKEDCTRIYFRLTAEIKGLDGPSATKHGVTILSLYGPWRYKRPQPKKKQKQRRASPRSQKPRHGASQA